MVSDFTSFTDPPHRMLKPERGEAPDASSKEVSVVNALRKVLIAFYVF